MKAYHNTRDIIYRDPYGALPLGETVTLSLDLWEAPGALCECRVWIDGRGDTWIPMKRRKGPDGARYTCTLTPEEPEILWYSFRIRWGGETWYCGAPEGAVGGVGELYPHEAPAFQITVYQERKVPDWYKKGIVYQIFPDRFARGADWKERTGEALAGRRAGPKKALCEDWYQPPRYEKDAWGAVIRWDFYGGTLSGIRENLPYLQELGISAIYLNPIFEAASNHRYDTGDYEKLDPMLGSLEDFSDLCSEAEAMGIRIILDGVFNHTGCDSKYFNKYGNYPDPGAYQGEDAPYRSWYRFHEDGSYESWWGVGDLPDVEEHEPSYLEFICGGKDSIVRRWLRAGASGWRLDVADELPDDFIAEIKSAALAEKEDALVIGEVWEDASNKVSYGQLRRYFLGEELDSVMNYPLREALLGFALGEIPGWAVAERLERLKENYPPEALYGALNLLGSHDRARLLTVLGDAPPEGSLTEAQRADYRLEPWQRELAKRRLWLLTLCQMTLPGVPCIYYGDEAGLEGYADPCNRGTFPWGREDPETQEIYRKAIALRQERELFVDGSFRLLELEDDDVFGFVREKDGEAAVVLVNRSIEEARAAHVPAFGPAAEELISGLELEASGWTVSVALEPLGAAVLYFPNILQA